MKTIALGIVSLMVLVAGYFVILQLNTPRPLGEIIDPTPSPMTMTGTYLCLPHAPGYPQTEECAFGIQADSGEFYAVNFGQSADSMQQFQTNARIRAEGFFIPKEALSTDQWNKYDMKGIFTVTRILEEMQQPQGKIDINAVCKGALAYMTFENGDAAETFVAECKEGKHPEVIEHWKNQVDVDNLQAI